MLTLALNSISNLINLGLKLDPYAIDDLQQFNNKTILIHSTTLNSLKILISFNKQGIKLSQFDSDNIIPDATISAPPATLLHLLLSENINHFDLKYLKLGGNIQLIDSVNQTIRRLELDWEGLLAKYIGDTPSVEFCKFVQALNNKKEQLKLMICQNISEYMQYEANIIPSTLELKDFSEDTDLLRLRTDRLQARTSRLLASLEKI